MSDISLCGTEGCPLAARIAELEAEKETLRQQFLGVIKFAVCEHFEMLPVISKLVEFLETTLNSETPMATSLSLQASDGTKEAEIRLWASKGQTPVERVAELKVENAELARKLAWQKAANADLVGTLEEVLDLLERRHDWRYIEIVRSAIERTKGEP